ncbi:hypothetical protein [Geothrix edaphica]|uniref:Uncharacterized protein n=1 Tax=Geothrix edaphica TaxID=2927976 RepID=A0ABQ5Q0V5_9BACT|nr:hypothetical protein [Geothrix edaphica]GLH68223.1 hypothetical protein GETHED_25870 [Geothrix edaphica]
MRWRDLESLAAFDTYMASVDARLRDHGVDIPARPLQACGMVSQECHVSFTMSSDIFARIHGWFESRYGDRLLIDMNVGKMLVHINEDPFVVTYPLIFGTVKVEPLRWIENVTDRLLESLPSDVMEDLLAAIIRGFQAFNEIRSNLPPPLTADLDAAPRYALQRPSAPGLSKWSSQQAAEKTLSAYISRKGGNPRSKPKGGPPHNLFHLNLLASKVGLPCCEERLLRVVDCSPNVRYPDRVKTTLIDAVLANQASILICQHVAAHWT